MRTRSTSTSERRAAALLGLALAWSVFAACDEREVTEVPEPICRVPQFRLCEADCGRAVEQCIEPGQWGPCSCVVLDATYVVDAAPDVSETPDAADAADATDAPDEARDAGLDGDAEGGEGGADAEPTDGPPSN